MFSVFFVLKNIKLFLKTILKHALTMYYILYKNYLVNYHGFELQIGYSDTKYCQ